MLLTLPTLPTFLPFLAPLMLLTLSTLPTFLPFLAPLTLLTLACAELPAAGHHRGGGAAEGTPVPPRPYRLRALSALVVSRFHPRQHRLRGGVLPEPLQPGALRLQPHAGRSLLHLGEYPLLAPSVRYTQMVRGCVCACACV